MSGRTGEAHVVLGGRGYLGSALVDRLQAEGRRPLLAVDLADPDGDGRRWTPFTEAGFPAAPGVQHARLDLTDPAATGELFRGLRAAWSGRLVVYHLAGLFPKEPEQRQRLEPEHYRRQNVDAVGTVVEALNAAGGPAVLVLQSTGGLERFSGRPIPDPYMESKAQAEDLVAETCAVDWVTLRPMRVVGVDAELVPPRRIKRSDLLADGLRAARRSGRIPPDVLTDLVLGAGATRDGLEILLPAANSHVAYVHLLDAVSALTWAASPLTLSRRTYRVTTSPAVTFAEIGQILVEELAAMGVPATTVERTSADPIRLGPPLSSEFAWRPSLPSSRQVVRAAVWQYLEAARMAVRAALADAAAGRRE